MNHCIRHYEEPTVALCRTCQRSFCSRCLVFAFGPNKPPYCVGCALGASGVRNGVKASPAASTAVPRADRKAEKAQRKTEKDAAKAAAKAAKAAARQPVPVGAPIGPDLTKGPARTALAPAANRVPAPSQLRLATGRDALDLRPQL